MLTDFARAYDPVNFETTMEFDETVGDVCKRSSHEHKIYHPDHTHGNIPQGALLVRVTNAELLQLLTETGVSGSVAERIIKNIGEIGPFSIVRRHDLAFFIGRGKTTSDA